MITMKQIFTVTGMTCGHCEKAVRNALQDADEAIQIITVDRTQNRVEVESAVPRETLAKAIADEGYGCI
jgi:copper chaperone